MPRPMLLLLPLFLVCAVLPGQNNRNRPGVDANLDKRTDGSIAVGQKAPDFELLKLKSTAGLKAEDLEKMQQVPAKAQEGKPTPERVRLSSFIGKKPVVLFFGSYT